MKKICAVLLFLLSAVCYSQTYSGTIIRVIDGDTYIFQTEEGSLRVRMLGIDAPERDQPSSKESTAFLSKFLNVEGILKVTDVDQYARSVGTLFIEGQDINLLSVRSGYSWHYKQYLKDSEYSAAQEHARMNKLGLWGDADPVAPWDWRKMGN